LKQLQVDMQNQRVEEADGEADKAKRVAANRKFCEDARAKVREMQATRAAEQAKAAEEAKAAKKEDTAPAKPKWAMTEKEHEEFDEEETCELLDFVDALNFDEYIQDFEFRDALDQIKNRAKKLDRAQEAFKKQLAEQFNEAEDDDASVAPSVAESQARRKPAPAEKDWDASTAASEAPSVVSEHKGLADRILKENESMRSVHSAASVARMIEKTQREKAESSVGEAQ